MIDGVSSLTESRVHTYRFTSVLPGFYLDSTWVLPAGFTWVLLGFYLGPTSMWGGSRGPEYEVEWEALLLGFYLGSFGPRPACH